MRISEKPGVTTALGVQVREEPGPDSTGIVGPLLSARPHSQGISTVLHKVHTVTDEIVLKWLLRSYCFST